ncbi:MAG: hypothetical protein ISR77_29735 [Pirellulaceae bacterium]|nr:hypothetical protein [Pirellulaceae bacterium]
MSTATTRHSLILMALSAAVIVVPANTKAGDESQQAAGGKATAVTTFAGPAGEEPLDDYEVRVDGKPVFVYRARVSAVPFNQVWPGYQRPLDQTEQASFAYWDMSGPVSVEITSKRSLDNVAIRPTSYGIRPSMLSQETPATIVEQSWSVTRRTGCWESFNETRTQGTMYASTNA